MTEEWDKDAWNRARAQADERFPLPDITPSLAGAKAALLFSLVIGLYVGLEEFLPQIWAGLIASAIAGLATFLDARSRFRSHVREITAVYDYLKHTEQ